MRSTALPGLLLLLAALASCSGAAPVPCTACGDVCVSLQTDESNCGACGNVCAAGTLCKAGTCATAPCAAPLVLCGGACVDPRNDGANCGSCGNACTSAQFCSQGTCGTAPCGAPLALCGAACVDTRSDIANCGSCGRACAAEQFCTQGMCAPIAPCGAAQKKCSGQCASVQTDSANCGDCGVACRPGTVCSAGTCATTCAAPLTTCPGADGGTACADPQSDRNNCGACGRVCTTAEGCEAGRCQPFANYPPRVCAQLPRQADGGLAERQTLFAFARLDAPFAARCPPNGLTYLELPQAADGGFNYSRRPGNIALTRGPDVVSTFAATPLIVDLASNLVFMGDRGDFTYATNVGVHIQDNTNGLPSDTISRIPYAEGNACTGNRGVNARGRGNVNLVGLPFAVGNATFVAGGFNGNGFVTYSSNRQNLDIFGDGFCGGYFPAAPIPLRYCPPTPGPEACDRLDNDCDGLVDNLADAGTCP